MVYVVLADGFEEIEAVAPIDILRRGGAKVCVAGFSEYITGSHGIKIAAEILLDEIDLSAAEMIILPGGPGHKILKDSSVLSEILKNAAEKGVTLAAICAAPTVLAGFGLLDGVKATCFPGMENLLASAVFTDAETVFDKNILTSKSAGTATAFALHALKILKGEAVSNKVREEIKYAEF